MKSIAYVLKTKPKSTWTVAPESSIEDALRLMIDRESGEIPVINAGRLVGLISAQDTISKVLLPGKSPVNTRVKDIMSNPVDYLKPDYSVEESLALMIDKQVRALPVVVDGHLIGVVSIGDLIQCMLADQRLLIRKLENHILENFNLV